jgi:hypothetical protein
MFDSDSTIGPTRGKPFDDGHDELIARLRAKRERGRRRCEAQERPLSGASGKVATARVTKNLLHYPLARPPHAVRWSRRGGRLVGVLHEDDDGRPLAEIDVPASLRHHAPSQYDVDLLYRLLALTQEKQWRLEGDLAHLRAGESIDEERRRRLAGEPSLLSEGEYLALAAGGPKGLAPLERFKDMDRRGVDSEAAYARAFVCKPPRWRGHSEKMAGRKAFRVNLGAIRRAGELDGQVWLRFRSLRALVVALGRAPNRPGNFASIAQSLRFWSQARVTFRRWYEGRQRVEKAFEPFVADVEIRDGGGLVAVRLSSEFVATGRKYYAAVPLHPVPRSIGAFNLDHWLQAFPHGAMNRPERDLARLCAVLGFNVSDPSRASEQFGRALAAINREARAAGRPTWRCKGAGKRGTNVTFVPIEPPPERGEPG